MSSNDVMFQRKESFPPLQLYLTRGFSWKLGVAFVVTWGSSLLYLSGKNKDGGPQSLAITRKLRFSEFPVTLAVISRVKLVSVSYVCVTFVWPVCARIGPDVKFSLNWNVKLTGCLIEVNTVISNFWLVEMTSSLLSVSSGWNCTSRSPMSTITFVEWFNDARDGAEMLFLASTVTRMSPPFV